MNTESSIKQLHLDHPYSVRCNEDQLMNHGYISKYPWSPAMARTGERLRNMVETSFDTIEQARVLYAELRDKKMAASRNWLD